MLLRWSASMGPTRPRLATFQPGLMQQLRTNAASLVATTQYRSESSFTIARPTCRERVLSGTTYARSSVLPRHHKASFATSSASSSCSRQEAESFARQAGDVIKGHMQDCTVELLGAYRQGKETIHGIVLMVTGQQDAGVPSGPNDRVHFRQQEEAIVDVLCRAGIIGSEDAGVLRMTANLNTTAKIIYTSAPCAGACKLYMTGDKSYTSFLELFAQDAMGLTLSPYGLWRCTDAASQAATEQRLRQSITKRGTETATSAVPTKQAKRMEEQRKAMGLPEGLDISLDLGGPSHAEADCATGSDGRVSEAALDGAPEGLSDGRTWERVVVGQGTEADILDILGMAWIPPQIRTVRAPKRLTEMN